MHFRRYCTLSPNFHGVNICDFPELLLDHEKLLTKQNSRHAWLVDEEVSVLSTVN